jgi:uncharacterized membrane protein
MPNRKTCGPCPSGLLPLCVVALLAFGSPGCGDGRVTEVVLLAEVAEIAVLSADPATGEQGAALEVRIRGKGFLDGAVATWGREGVADTLIVVDQVVFVSDTELRATITIGMDADIGSYDVTVSNRRKGIGSEEPTGVGDGIFTVRSYEPQRLVWPGSGLPFASVFGINDGGVIVGAGVSPHRATYWTAEQGHSPFGSDPSVARGINNHGYIAGARGGPAGCGAYCHYVGFVYHAERGFTDLRSPMGDEGSSQAMAINDASTVVGWAARGTNFQELGRLTPVVWRRDADGKYAYPIELAMNSSNSSGVATAVNARGDVVGTLTTGFIQTAVLWSVQDDGSYAAPIVLGGSASGSRASGINDHGWIVGATRETGATLWLPGNYRTPVSIGDEASLLLASHALAINNDGAVVGWMVTAPGGTHSRMCCEYYGQGVLWLLDGSGATVETVDLVGTSGHDRSLANAVNRHGWVVGFSWRGGEGFSYREATLWRPDQ